MSFFAPGLYPVKIVTREGVLRKNKTRKTRNVKKWINVSNHAECR
jgi:hypothetical protein